MSTFVVRVHHVGRAAFRGEVRHVPTGAVARFANEQQLLAFFAEMNAVQLPSASAVPPEPVEGGGPKRGRTARTR